MPLPTRRRLSWTLTLLLSAAGSPIVRERNELQFGLAVVRRFGSATLQP